MSYHFI